jgi:hypothetical protein
MIMILIIVGCGGGGASEESYDNQKITDWQSRETICDDISTTCPDTGDLFSDLESLLGQLPEFRHSHTADDGDYWNTSCESLDSDGVLDCDDESILAYRTVINSCLMGRYDLDVRIRLLDYDGSIGHAVCVIYYEYGVYEINNLVLQDFETDWKINKEFDLYTIF